MFAKNTTILFQGDSITDGARGRNQDLNHILGHGYAYLVAARLTAEHPELDLHFHNRGCSGHRIVDLYARWKEDSINLKPDIVSILCGVNDVGSIFSRDAGVSAERYEKVYKLILDETLDALPKTRFVLCEPFILPTENMRENWNAFKKEIDLRRDIVKHLASDYDAVFVPTQEMFEKACEKAPADYWLWDGVHPMPAGHELLARAWLTAVEGSTE